MAGLQGRAGLEGDGCQGTPFFGSPAGQDRGISPQTEALPRQALSGTWGRGPGLILVYGITQVPYSMVLACSLCLESLPRAYPGLTTRLMEQLRGSPVGGHADGKVRWGRLWGFERVNGSLWSLVSRVCSPLPTLIRGEVAGGFTVRLQRNSELTRGAEPLAWPLHGTVGGSLRLWAAFGSATYPLSNLGILSPIGA